GDQNHEGRQRGERPGAWAPAAEAGVHEQTHANEDRAPEGRADERCAELVHFPFLRRTSSRRARSFAVSPSSFISRTKSCSRDPRKTRSSTSPRSLRETSSYDRAGR